jgi:hypothetical protein
MQFQDRFESCCWHSCAGEKRHAIVSAAASPDARAAGTRMFLRTYWCGATKMPDPDLHTAGPLHCIYRHLDLPMTKHPQFSDQRAHGACGSRWHNDATPRWLFPCAAA